LDKKTQRLITLTNIGLLLAFVVVVLGAFTRLVDAGLGCPDWPGCYGFLSVPESHEEIAQAQERFPDALVESEKAWPEMIHRYFAGALGLLILGIAWFTFQYSRENAQFRSSRISTLCTVLLVLVICQAAFGMWTVTLKLWPQIVTTHLLGGFATLSLLWVIRLKLDRYGLPSRTLPGADILVSDTSIRRHARLGLVILVFQIALGGWTSSNYAALACPDFPTCQNEFWPEMDLKQGFDVFQTLGPNYLGGLMSGHARVAIHMMHRSGAVVTLFALLILGLRMLSRDAVSKESRVAVNFMFALLACQLALGIANVVFSIPLWVATMHNGVGVLLLLSVISVNARMVSSRVKI